ncbi:lipopolysaccharide heptosyltransferase II [Sulfurimonas lithotrophica]|uniref:lipopolysaccharide heptosyltransferase II n=2 Tax=Sulfurimonas lithotrophica TaxID=2590022 RepID=A0A5P8P3S6_9BACT|nr:lipopolysaccharide heptosyltransferase II [Sulfurimonas lithotrophica]
MTTPAIENIVKTYPDAKLTIYGSYVSTRLFLHHPSVEKIFIDESKKEGFRYLNLYRDAKKVGKFDIALSFRKNFTTQYLLFFLGVKKRYIYKRYTKKEIHQVLRYNVFINKSFEIQTTPGKLKIYGYESEKSDKKILGLNPGATYGSAKRWYPEEFAKVAIEMSKDYDIVIFGGPNEDEIAADIEKLLVDAGVKNYQNLAAKTSVEELISGISKLDLFVTNDSGPMHLAATFGVPTVTIFGPTKYTETNQWMNEKGVIVTKDLDCAPCMKRICPLGHHNCMKLIKADDVLEKIREVL